MKFHKNAKKSNSRHLLTSLFMGACAAMPVLAQEQPTPDLSTEKVLYAVGTAHLDTQWNWTIQTTINDYLKKTLNDNFSRFAAYPNYVFSFEGSFRYMLMKEYYPDLYATMSDYIAQGRWRVAGSTVEQGDMNVISPESMIRQTLLGNNYFEDEFGKRSTDIFLPDCFGFSYTMPTWMTHCGLNGFSSQKLSWGGSVPAPFNIGVWQGPDGSSVIAALNPGAYVSSIGSDLSNDTGWLDRINANGASGGVFADYMYHGTGDTGGAPSTGSCSWLEQSIAGGGPVKVISAGSDDLYNHITPAQKAAMPVYDGELLMRTHGTGCYTSQAAMKRWNRQNELLADSAEKIAVLADHFGAGSYPQSTLDAAWTRFLWHTFHDDLTGTSIPAAYKFSWNDEILSLNQFASVLTDSLGGVIQGLDTQVVGQAVVVYNPLAVNRQDIVEATIKYDNSLPDHVIVYDGTTEVPSQIVSRSSDTITVAFLADMPSVALKTYDIRASEQACSLATGLSITNNKLENDLYRVTINSSGDISSVYDKVNSRELLSAPSRLELIADYSPEWPAWEIMFSDIQQMPVGYVSGPARIRIIENGPARVALEITRTYGMVDPSTFVQTISLACAGDQARQVTVENLIDWRTTGMMLKASFPLTASAPMATYDLGMGTISRANNTSNKYEVPAQQWADITNSDNIFGVSIFNDCRYGWDKPANNLLRLTLLHTPSVSTRYTPQSTLDIGQHKVTYAIAPHTGKWDAGFIPQRAAGLNQPFIAAQAPVHAGSLGREYSMLQVDNDQVMVKAVKKAQRSDEIIVRVQELYGRAVNNVNLSFAGGIASARLVDGCERYISDLALVNGKVNFNMTAYQPMSFALTLAESGVTLAPVSSAPVALNYNLDAFSYDSNRSNGNFDNGMTYPAELISSTVTVNNIPFQIGSRQDNSNNALACVGQTVALGSHNYDSLYFLAAARGGDTQGTFMVAGQPVAISIQDYHEHVADWGREIEVPYIKNDVVGWVGTHRHNPSGNMAYEFCNMFLYRLDLPAGTSSVVLPDNSNIVIFAMTMVDKPSDAINMSSELIDTLPYLPKLAPKPDTRTDLALNKPVIADSFVGGEVPALAVDGSVSNNSKWCAVAGTVVPHWLVVDLQGNYDIDTVMVFHASAGGEGDNWNTKDFAIQSSLDGVNDWVDIVNVTGNTAGISRHEFMPVNVRYLRLYVTQPTQDTNTAVRIYGFQVYGPCDGYLVTGDISGPDGDADCRVDLFDMQAIAQNWLLCNQPLNPDCDDYWFARYPDSGSDVVVPDSSLGSLPADKLAAHWKVTQASGTTLQDFTATNDSGTLAGAVTPTLQTGWFSSQGIDNKALYFSPKGYVEITPVTTAPVPNLHNITSGITISAWFNADDWAGNRRILQKGNSDNQYRLLAERGELVFDIYNIGRVTTALPTAGQWHHIAGVYDGSSMRLYVDGVEAVVKYASGSINITSDKIYIGTKNPSAPSGDHFKGYIDDIRIYTVGLTAQQIRTLASQGDNLMPVILDIHRRQDIMVSLMGNSALDAVVFDANSDSLSFNWVETSGTGNVSFLPSASIEDPTVQFSQPGSYTVQLEVSDGSGMTSRSEASFELVNMDEQSIRLMGLEITGDITGDCHIDIYDLEQLVGNWLAEAISAGE